jgi:2,3-bisphosphoglycerate-dependent phosphoglycerate mutase
MPEKRDRWPERLWLVRHGESAGNVARDAAYASGHTHIEIAVDRDIDVPLSDRGVEQSRALGRWFAEQAATERPEVLLSSPYLRARHTGELIRESGGLIADAPCVFDERLREREFGILDRLTRAGIQQLHPQQAEFRRKIGKFYHRPPGGESWCDVILRLRSALDTLSLHYAMRRVVIVSHEVVVMCLRYLLENLDEARLMAIDQEGDIANCGITEYAFDPRSPLVGGGMVLRRFNYTVPLEEEGAPVTVAPDANVAAR